MLFPIVYLILFRLGDRVIDEALLASESLLGFFEKLSLIETPQTVVGLFLQLNFILDDVAEIFAKLVPSSLNHSLALLHIVQGHEVAPHLSHDEALGSIRKRVKARLLVNVVVESCVLHQQVLVLVFHWVHLTRTLMNHHDSIYDCFDNLSSEALAIQLSSLEF